MMATRICLGGHLLFVSYSNPRRRVNMKVLSTEGLLSKLIQLPWSSTIFLVMYGDVLAWSDTIRCSFLLVTVEAGKDMGNSSGSIPGPESLTNNIIISEIARAHG